jgi:hypothetical protein
MYIVSQAWLGYWRLVAYWGDYNTLWAVVGGGSATVVGWLH